MKNVLILGGLLIASLGFAESSAPVAADSATTTESAQGTSTVVAPVPATSGVIGSIELRPSVETPTGNFRSENEAMLGYALSKTRSLKLDTQFNTLFKSGNTTNFNAAEMVTLSARFAADELFALGDSGINFAYESRVYFPVVPDQRDMGHITSIRNYGKLSKQLGAAKMTLAIVPIFHIYNVKGTTNSKGQAEANPVFENRVYLMSDISVGKVTISPGLWWSAKKHRDYFTNAKHNGGWSQYVEFDLDVTYEVAPKVNVGLGFYTDNLLKESAQGFYDGVNVGDGFRKGVAQVILNAAL